jgi:hypothetical protein
LRNASAIERGRCPETRRGVPSRPALATLGGLLIAVGAFAVTPAANARSVNPHIAAFVQFFANGAPVQVRCPDSLDEWNTDLGGREHIDDVYGVTFTQTSVVEFRADLCVIMDNLAQSTADESTKALAVLALLHESYHVRHWTWRFDEAHVECQAIRHFRIGVRVLGGSRQLADELFPHGLAWHHRIAAEPAYFLPSCRLPSARTAGFP